MSGTRTVARNVLWNWAGLATQMIAGIIMVPFLVGELGEAGYGLWILIAALTGYFDLFDLGLRGSLGRNIAYYRARGDEQAVNAIISTGLALLLAGASLVLLASLGAPWVYYNILSIPDPFYQQVWLALVLVGVNLALIFPLSVCDGILWAQERFDLLNWIDIPAVILRTVLTLVLLPGADQPLVLLAGILIAVTAGSGLAKIVCVMLLDRRLRLGWRHCHWNTARELLHFGIWMFVLSLSHTITGKLGEFLIGNRIGTTLVAPYAVAARLVEYVRSLMITSTGVLTPRATALHAQDQQGQQQTMFVLGGRLCLCLALFAAGLFFLVGGDLLRLWLRRELAYAPELLCTLMVGQIVPLSQLVTYSMVLGIGAHRYWAILGLVEAVLIVVLALCWLPLLGVLGIGWAVAVPLLLCRGVLPLLHGCRLLRVPLSLYLRQAVLPALGAAVPAVLLLAGLTWLAPPRSWWLFLVYLAIYGSACLASIGCLVLGPRRWQRLLRRSPAPSPAPPLPPPTGTDSREATVMP